MFSCGFAPSWLSRKCLNEPDNREPKEASRARISSWEAGFPFSSRIFIVNQNLHCGSPPLRQYASPIRESSLVSAALSYHLHDGATRTRQESSQILRHD